ncbi:MAG: hypothetical protein ACE5IW_01565 [bacterium]
MSNTGTVLHMSEANALDLMSQTGEVFIPKAVDIEIAKHIAQWISNKVLNEAKAALSQIFL